MGSPSLAKLQMFSYSSERIVDFRNASHPGKRSLPFAHWHGRFSKGRGYSVHKPVTFKSAATHTYFEAWGRPKADAASPG